MRTKRGAFFVDPHAREPYLFHLARVSVVRRPPPAGSPVAGMRASGPDRQPAEIVESRLLGLRQAGGGAVEPCPLEHLLLQRGARNVAPGSVPLARIAGRLADEAGEWLRNDALAKLVEEHRARIEQSLPERVDWVARGWDHRAAELTDRRQHVARRAARAMHGRRRSSPGSRTSSAASPPARTTACGCCRPSRHASRRGTPR